MVTYIKENTSSKLKSLNNLLFFIDKIKKNLVYYKAFKNILFLISGNLIITLELSQSSLSYTQSLELIKINKLNIKKHHKNFNYIVVQSKIDSIVYYVNTDHAKKYFFKKKIICTAVSKKKKITFYLGLQKFQLISFDPTNGKINYSINTK
ncbi:hypothetical protein BNATCHR2113 (nucleomorph) [Bigelowiella natans]|uniref:Uncharacterized protein n=1 Tax=Bigelowiella natans TaxID=227086 RepID=Q3LW33_BIGNA|nr:hypothetical protein BNATCHR2113 [Bigelowiella natans]ABA27332.1 hypothetical protein [Bigelowiella natans]